MKALHFGAGKIGRGFIGAKLAQSGYKVTFADTATEIVAEINRSHSYTVHIVDYNSYNEDISGISALISDSEQTLKAISEAQLITTAVSMGRLCDVAKIMASGLTLRRKINNNTPLNIICCENGVRATSQFKRMLLQHTDDATTAWIEEHIGFVDCAVDRIVPIVSFGNPLDVAVEEFCEWKVENTALKGELLPIPSMQRVENLDAYINRKLFTLNTAHCATAYLGALRDCKYIHEATNNSWVQERVCKAMSQSSNALIAEFSLSTAEQQRYSQQILRRFANPYINDRVSRVARDPIRKLSPALYFTAPINMALKHSLAIDALAVAVAAALKYRADDDMQSLQIGEMIKNLGIKPTISQITAITNPATVAMIADAFDGLM